MNLKMLRLIWNGKLGYLRHGWEQRQGIDPLVYYIGLRFLIYVSTTLILLITTCAVVGSYSLTKNFLGSEPFDKTIPLMDNIPRMFPVIFVMFVSMFIGFRYQYLAKTKWDRTSQFVKDIWTLQRVVSQSLHQDLDCLIGNGVEVNGAKDKVPKHVLDRLREEILSHAKVVKRNHAADKDYKILIKEWVSMGYRLGIFDEDENIGVFYRRAEVAIEKSEGG